MEINWNHHVYPLWNLEKNWEADGWDLELTIADQILALHTISKKIKHMLFHLMKKNRS